MRKLMIKIWSGDVSLIAALLGVGVIAMIVIKIFRFFLSSLENLFWAGMQSGRVEILDLALFYAVASSVLIFWLGSAWHAAGRTKAKSPRAAWGAMVAIAILASWVVYAYSFVAVPQFADAVNYARDDPEWGIRGVKSTTSPRVIELYGYITGSVVAELQSALDHNPKISLVELSGRGGRASPALQIKYLIHRRGIDTLVIGECDSACVVAFSGGVRRWISPTAKLGFHSAGFGAGEADAANSLLYKEFLATGISDAFLKRAFSIPTSQIWYPSINELESGHVITGILQTGHR